MKYIIPFLFLALIAACTNTEKLLPQDEGTWTLQSEAQELAFDAGLVYSFDSTNSATLVFNNNMVTRVDSNGMDDFRWIYDKKEETVTLLDQSFIVWVSGTAVQKASFEFQVLESKKNTQLWRSTESFRTFNPFTSDTTTATLTIQWRLTR